MKPEALMGFPTNNPWTYNLSGNHSQRVHGTTDGKTTDYTVTTKEDENCDRHMTIQGTYAGEAVDVVGNSSTGSDDSRFEFRFKSQSGVPVEETVGIQYALQTRYGGHGSHFFEAVPGAIGWEGKVDGTSFAQYMVVDNGDVRGRAEDVPFKYKIQTDRMCEAPPGFLRDRDTEGSMQGTIGHWWKSTPAAVTFVGKNTDLDKVDYYTDNLAEQLNYLRFDGTLGVPLYEEIDVQR